MLKQLLDEIERQGFKDDTGVLLTNFRQWHTLREKLKGCKTADELKNV